MLRDARRGLGFVALYAEFRIFHSRGNLLPRLRRALPPEDRTAMGRSIAFGGGIAGQQLVSYATETRTLRLIILSVTRDQLEAIVEPLDDEDARRVAGELWRTIRRACRFYGVRLASLRLIDDITGDTVARGILAGVQQSPGGICGQA
jgi:hypothetical protein